MLTVISVLFIVALLLQVEVGTLTLMSAIFTTVFFLIFAFILTVKSISKDTAKKMMADRTIFRGETSFEHYFLANDGIFVAGIQHRPSILPLSAIYSLCGFLAIILAIANSFHSNWGYTVTLAIIAAIVFFSPIGQWFPHVNSTICMKRTIANYTQKYPNDKISHTNNPLYIIATLKSYYESALSLSRSYFFGDDVE